MSNWLLKILSSVAEAAKYQFVKQTQNTRASQEQFLKKLLAAHQNTSLGRSHQLASIQTIDEFRARIPIWSYADYEPYIDRIAKGEQNVLTRDRVVYFNVTSGSTGKQKLIPVTAAFQRSLGWANLIGIGFLSAALKKRDRRLRKILLTNSAYLSGYTPAGIPYGSGSTGVLKMGRWLYSCLFAQPYETLQVQDSHARHYVCLLFALQDRNLGGIVANFPMLVLRIAKYLETDAASLIQDIQQGTIAPWLDLEPELRRTLEAQLQPNPERARELRDRLQRHGRLTPTLAWPQLTYLTTARGGTSDFYFQRFPDYFDNLPVFGGAYASAESTYSIYPDLNTDGSVLAVGTGFFEFIPESQWQQANPQTQLAHEVRVGQRYRILVSNYSGFYRYDNGDVVEVVGFYHQAPLLVFRYRQGGIISSTVEKTTEAHAVTAVQRLQAEFDLSLEDFCITLSEDETPAHYVLNLELASDASWKNAETVLRRFDAILQQVNPRYGEKRQGLVPPPRLHLLAPGSFNVVRQRQRERGVPDSQLKFPHISEDRSLMAGLAVLAVVDFDEDSSQSG